MTQYEAESLVHLQTISDSLVTIGGVLSEVAPWVATAAFAASVCCGVLLWQVLIRAKDGGKVW